MPREDLTKIDGVVTEVRAGGIFAIRLANGKIILARLSGRMRKFHIRVIPGDKVQVGLSPYDLSHGLILSREKLGGPPPVA